MKRTEVEKQAEKSDVEARDFYIWYV